MALATTCPQCKTSFKVVPDQLKLRRGLVRCGVCQHVFSGIDYISQVLPTATKEPPAKASVTPVEEPSADTQTTNDEALNTAFFIPDTVLAPSTKMMMDAFESRVNRESVELAKPPSSIKLREDEKLLRKGAPKSSLFDQADEPEDDELAAVNFFSGEEPRKGMRGFSNRSELLLVFTTFILGALLILQMLVGARHSLAAHFPVLSSTIDTIASVVGLKVETPRAMDGLTIESFELQASTNPGIYSLSAILRNSATTVVKWPAIELTLTDTTGNLLLKKVLLPIEYLPPMLTTLGFTDLAQAEKLGFKSSGELPLKLALEVTDLIPSGFSAALFYP
jgi:predicted Zn finger-like uncharacterized protein